MSDIRFIPPPPELFARDEEIARAFREYLETLARARLGIDDRRAERARRGAREPLSAHRRA